MNCLRHLVVVASVALLLLNTRIDATVYNLPRALPQFQGFRLNASSMDGSVYVYNNEKKENISYEFDIRKPNGSEATINFTVADGQQYTYGNFSKLTFNSTGANLTLSGKWGNEDYANIYYKAPNATYQDFNDRNATNLNVWGVIPLAFVKGSLRIWANSTCRVIVTSGGTYNLFKEGCGVTLKFTGGPTINASVTDQVVKSTGNYIEFRVETTCSAGDLVVYYMEDCSKAPNSASTIADSLKGQKLPALLVLCVLLTFML